MQSTKLIHEVADTEQPFMTARYFLQNAQQVIFLGFSFAADNVGHLGTHDAIARTIEVHCTAYDMTEAEVGSDLIPAFNTPDVLQRADMKAQRFLRERIHLLR